MKKFFLLATVVLIAFSCKKNPERQFRCGDMNFTLPKGWSFDFANNDFSTFLIVDSSWSFSPKSWTGHAATGDEAGARVIVTICHVKTNREIRALLENSQTPESEILISFFDEYSEYYRETLEQMNSEVIEDQLPSGTWYLLSYRQPNTFEGHNHHYLLEGRIKIHGDTLYLIFMKDFEDAIDRNRRKYFDKILKSIQFNKI